MILRGKISSSLLAISVIRDLSDSQNSRDEEGGEHKSVFGQSGQRDQVLSFRAFNSANRRLGIKSAAVHFHRLPAGD